MAVGARCVPTDDHSFQKTKFPGLVGQQIPCRKRDLQQLPPRRQVFLASVEDVKWSDDVGSGKKVFVEP